MGVGKTGRETKKEKKKMKLKVNHWYNHKEWGDFTIISIFGIKETNNIRFSILTMEGKEKSLSLEEMRNEKSKIKKVVGLTITI